MPRPHAGRRPGRAVAAAVALGCAAAGCTGSGADDARPGPAVSAGTSVPAAASASPQRPAPAQSPAPAGSLAVSLRERLRIPALPSFTLPTDLLTSARDRDVAGRLDIDPGLYEGIAVVGARCEAGGEARAADSGTPLSGAAGAGTYKDAARAITVAGDGTGVYDGPGLHVAVLAGGSGVFDDGTVRLSVQPGGAGTYTAGGRRLTVRPDGSGSYQDADVRLWVGADGAGGYDDASTHVSVTAAGTVSGSGDPADVAAVRAVVAAGLPRFAPVPRISRVAVRGRACGTIVRLDADVLFDSGSADLRPAAAALLVRVGALLRALQSPRASVDGFTDAVGTEADNLALSRRRAESVRRELVRLGVDPASLTPRGLGETRPVRPEVRADGRDDPAARQLNRRVELLLADG